MLAKNIVLIGGVLLHMKGRAETLAKGQELVADALASGRALHHFETMLRCQGVGAETARQLCHGDMWAVLPRVPSNQITTLNVTRSGINAPASKIFHKVLYKYFNKTNKKK
jgi:hypothetical protein